MKMKFDLTAEQMSAFVHHEQEKRNRVLEASHPDFRWKTIRTLMRLSRNRK
jgi:hypothetical protein